MALATAAAQAAQETPCVEEAKLLATPSTGDADAPVKAPVWQRGPSAALVTLAVLALVGGLCAFAASPGARAVRQGGAGLEVILASEKHGHEDSHKVPVGHEGDKDAKEDGSSTGVVKGDKDAKEDGSSTGVVKETVCLAVADYDGKGQKDFLAVQMGDVVTQFGEETGSGWAWVQKVGHVDKGKKSATEKVQVGYVPTWAIKPIPDGSGENATGADVKHAAPAKDAHHHGR